MKMRSRHLLLLIVAVTFHQGVVSMSQPRSQRENSEDSPPVDAEGASGLGLGGTPSPPPPAGGPGSGSGEEAGIEDGTMPPRPLGPGPGGKPSPPPPPGRSGSGSGEEIDVEDMPMPHPSRPPSPPMSSGSGEEVDVEDRPMSHKPGPPRPPSPPTSSGSGEEVDVEDRPEDSSRPHTPGPGGEHTPGPGGEHTPGPGGEHTPRPGGEHTPRPGGEHTPRPGSGHTPRPPKPMPGRPEHNQTVTEALVNQNYTVHMYGGDIALTPEQQATLEATSNQNSPFSIQNAVVKSEQYLWKNGIVYYTFDDSLSNSAISAIQEAMDRYTEQTCITFEARSDEEDYVRFYSGNGCYSYIGRLSGPQDISIGRGCEYQGIVMHEIFHALGRWHEQSRPDRDIFIKINDDNIASGVESNFDVVSTAFATTQGLEYDFNSLMHYDAYAFSRNGRPTIEPVDPSISLDSLGQRDDLSMGDLKHVNTLYCGANVGGVWSEWGEWSECSLTCNGGTRSRLRSCEGGADCDGNNIDTEQCNTQACATEAVWGDWSAWSECTATCGGGRRTRRRSCEGGNTCVGRQTEYTDCNTDSCPEGSAWSEWGSWSDCSQTCQGGTRYRRRQCQNGNDCEGSNVLVEYCNSNVPCEETVTTSEWTEWSECTESCGGGTQFRIRGCTQNSSVCESEEQPCNTDDCNPEPELLGIEHVGCYWVPAYSDLFFLEGTTEDLSDNPRERQDPIRKCGNAAQLYNFEVFALAVGFCISGSNNVREYQYIETDVCEGGIGAYYFRWMAMDVYKISNIQSFRDSSQTTEDTEATPTDPSLFPDLIPAIVDGATGGQVPLALPSLVLLVLLALISLIV